MNEIHGKVKKKTLKRANATDWQMGHVKSNRSMGSNTTETSSSGHHLFFDFSGFFFLNHELNFDYFWLDSPYLNSKPLNLYEPNFHVAGKQYQNSIDVESSDDDDVFGQKPKAWDLCLVRVERGRIFPFFFAEGLHP